MYALHYQLLTFRVLHNWGFNFLFIMLIRQIWMNGPNTGLFVKPFFWVTPGPCSQSLLSPVINCWGRFFVKCCPRFLRLSSVYFESIKCGETWWRSQTIHTLESERGRYLSSIKQSGHQCKLRWKICLHQSHFCLIKLNTWLHSRPSKDC